MKRYEYFVGNPNSESGKRIEYPVLCRYWDDFDQDAESGTRLVSWYHSRETAEIEAKAFQANADDAIRGIAVENEANRAWWSRAAERDRERQQEEADARITYAHDEHE